MREGRATGRHSICSLIAIARSSLLVAAAVERVAIFTSVAKVPDARIAGVAFAGLHSHQPFATVRKPLELDGGKCI